MNPQSRLRAFVVAACRQTVTVGAVIALGAITSRASDIADCRLGIAGAVLRQVSAHQAAIDQCLKFATYNSCQPGPDFFEAAEALLLRVTTDESSACSQALQGGASIGDLAPATCRGRAWYDTEDYWWAPQCDSPIGDLDDLWECMHCETADLGARVGYDLDLPIDPPASLDDRKCVRAAHAAVSRAVRTGIQGVIRCAGRSGEPPWSCSLDLSADGVFERTLGGIAKKVSKCRDASGVVGRIGPAASEMCNAAIESPADLAACLRRSAICQACMASNVALDLNQDCVAASGDLDCTYDPNKPKEGSFFVSNRDDDTLSFYGDDGEPAFGTLAASSFASGPAPTEVAVSEKSNTVSVINSGDDSVTTFHAGSGAPIAGSLAASTVVVGAAPAALFVNPERDLLYVANSGDGTVTFLDASDGSYAFGALAASTFPVGQEPASLATNLGGTMLYVANASDGTVTFLDASTGLPWFGLLANSTFDAGTEPRSIALRDDAILVADANDGVVRALNAQTGMPMTFSGGPQLAFAPAPMHLAVAQQSGDLYAVSGTTSEVLTSSYDRGFENIVVDGIPSDVALGANGSQVGAGDATPSARPLIVTFSDRDEAVMASTNTNVTNAGLSPAELSSVDKEDFRDWVYSSATGKYYAARFTNSYTPAGIVGVIDGTSLTLDREIPSLPGTSRVAYSEAHDTIFAATFTDGMVLLDGTSGQGKFGTLEDSTVDCGCSYILDVARSDATDRVYILCEGYVVYVDASTGDCLGGSPFTTGGGGSYTGGLAIDEVSGSLFSSYDGGIYALDPVNPTYRSGTLAASTLSGSSGRYDLIRVDGHGRVYGGRQYSGNIDAFDIATGLLMAQATSGFDLDDFEVDYDNGIVRGLYDQYYSYYYYHPFLTYYDLSDLTYLSATWLESRLELAYPVSWQSSLAYGPDYSVVVTTSHATRVRRDVAGFEIDHRELGGKTVATGDFPAGVAAMPAHTLY